MRLFHQMWITPYSYAWLDLRLEPVVLTMPPFEKERYVSVELINLYSYIVGYISPRTCGNKGGDFLVTGPDWHGVVPSEIRSVFRSPDLLPAGDVSHTAIQPGGN